MAPAARDRRLSPRAWRHLHAVLTVVWFGLAVPTVLVWPDSVVFVGIASCYANAVGHFAAWQATRAEEQGSD